jgi:hypothetical protein
VSASIQSVSESIHREGRAGAPPVRMGVDPGRDQQRRGRTSPEEEGWASRGRVCTITTTRPSVSTNPHLRQIVLAVGWTSRGLGRPQPYPLFRYESAQRRTPMEWMTQGASWLNRGRRRTYQELLSPEGGRRVATSPNRANQHPSSQSTRMAREGISNPHGMGEPRRDQEFLTLSHSKRNRIL